MKLTEKILFFIVFCVVIGGAILSHSDLRMFEDHMVREDGPVEWLTVLALFIGFILCLYRAYILKPFRPLFFRLCLIVMAGIFFFGVGEEISWGQRLFNIESPKFFKTYNSQQETNLHNLIIGEFKTNRVIFGTGLGIMVATYFLIIPYLYRRKENFRKFINRFALPIPKIAHIVFYLALFLICELGINGGKKGEILEFGGCWIFLLMTFNPYNREMFSRVSFKH